jgi:pimeloyl-ACP methyl ester carboxylesterase
MTAGATYSSMYWNWPQNPALYSYVDKTLNQGRATLTYDRIGSGKSSHPISTDITMVSDAYVLHELVQVLHVVGYHQVNSVGHSYGSGIAMREAATYKDVSRVVLTGYLHAGRNPIVAAATYPANGDPAFAGQNLDPGYLTTTPATSTTPSGRQVAFYSSSADPAVIKYDDAHKDLVSASGFVGFFGDKAAPAGSNLSDQITVPVLSIAGDQDATGCFDPSIGGLNCSNPAAVQSHEAPYYAGAASFVFKQVPNTGHDLTLHPSANQSFQMINQWIESH